jgi:hypothetical protein
MFYDPSGVAVAAVLLKQRSDEFKFSCNILADKITLGDLMY